jgi:electron transfer flavoprotein beta subunit
VRINASPELDSRTVAGAIADHLHDVDLVLCGDYSIDRGTGSVPAFLAAELGTAQALGLVGIDVTTATTLPLRVVRRLDGGRREVLDVPLPAVLSVEGSVARLRRASLAASLASRGTSITTVAGPYGRPAEAEVHPYRPRARTLPAPPGDSLSRVKAILDVGGHEGHAETVSLDPPAAARRILEQLDEWGYDTPTTPR